VLNWRSKWEREEIHYGKIQIFEGRCTERVSEQEGIFEHVRGGDTHLSSHQSQYCQNMCVCMLWAGGYVCM
jgi:hypothetical protein